MPMADESHNVRTGFVEVPGYKAILEELPPTLKPLFVCGYHVSTRKGELKNIVWPQVDFDEGVIVLEPADTKTGKGRYLPIYGDMGEWLTKQKAVRDAEFPECPLGLLLAHRRLHAGAWRSPHEARLTRPEIRCV